MCVERAKIIREKMDGFGQNGSTSSTYTGACELDKTQQSQVIFFSGKFMLWQQIEIFAVEQ